jgi:hypothetical protein
MSGKKDKRALISRNLPILLPPYGETRNFQQEGGGLMKRVWLLLGLMVLGAALTTGCVQMGAGVTASSLPITSRDSYTVVGKSHGSSMALGLAGLQLWPTSAYNALQEAKQAAKADGLVNIKANNIVYYIPPVFPILTIHRIVVEGDAIRFERNVK